jgi:hypothetical protein
MKPLYIKLRGIRPGALRAESGCLRIGVEVAENYMMRNFILLNLHQISLG